LIEHCEREPRARIEFCLGLSNPSDAYRKAWQILRETCGDSNEVIKTYTFKLKNGPQIAARDSEGLWNFACELEQFWYTMDDIGNMSPLNDRYNLTLISKRLPTQESAGLDGQKRLEPPVQLRIFRIWFNWSNRRLGSLGHTTRRCTKRLKTREGIRKLVL